MRVLFYYRGIEAPGVEYLMSYLKMKGHQVGLLFDPGLDDNLFLKLKFMKRFNQYEYLLEKARDFKPDILAFSIVTNIYPFINAILPTLKKELSVPVIAGGPHVSALPEYVLQNEHIDMACIGEGELAFAELLDKMERGVEIYDTKNIWFKKDGEIIKNDLRGLVEDLDQLPFPEKGPFYEYGCFHDNLEVVTGRGCPYNCTFCNIHFQRSQTKGKGNFLRQRSGANVIQEIKKHLELYDVKCITFHDDNFTSHPQWIEEFTELYRKEVNLPFYCFAYPTSVNREIISHLKRANCMQIFMGLESGDPNIRRDILKRPMSNERIISSANIIKDSGIRLQISGIFGFPEEKPESMWKTVELAETIAPDLITGYVFYPFPKTELFNYAVKSGYLGEEEVEMVKRGEGAIHHESILRHPEKKLASTLARLIPIYIKSPSLFKPLIKKIMVRKKARLALLIYLVSIPVALPFLGIEGIKVTLKMAWRAYHLRRKPLAQEDQVF
ncbi:Fe-S oxidoreductase [Candidatus Scalindua japonica]|uniref:Fe-S oxidoreductase n=1 Tax=Candidatus Scalindua japonica TaxID=1284222 RepID=A0A286TTJ9_9BACT|nr:radical SAM protein [Candidatus Scalindua japonica]GAX59198.1 Fe-S oxidoreductase [Candidatus Scalindua japonica]